jgi:hypothetical protein
MCVTSPNARLPVHFVGQDTKAGKNGAVYSDEIISVIRSVVNLAFLRTCCHADICRVLRRSRGHHHDTYGQNVKGLNISFCDVSGSKRALIRRRVSCDLPHFTYYTATLVKFKNGLDSSDCWFCMLLISAARYVSNWMMTMLVMRISQSTTVKIWHKCTVHLMPQRYHHHDFFFNFKKIIHVENDV